MNYKNNAASHTSAWNYNTVAYIDLYLINNDGSEVYWQQLAFQPWNIAEGSTVVLGDYYLSSNYRGVRIGSLTAYCSNYMSTSGTAVENGTFNFDFYNLAWAETEDQFNNLNSNVINAYNAANSANNAAQQAKSSADAAKSRSL
ncbi:MAG TPA: hypothetical protein PK728_08350 [Bacillota bacterium]|nr:hypothetical protein [Bacillota bacterium]